MAAMKFVTNTLLGRLRVITIRMRQILAIWHQKTQPLNKPLKYSARTDEGERCFDGVAHRVYKGFALRHASNKA